MVMPVKRYTPRPDYNPVGERERAMAADKHEGEVITLGKGKIGEWLTEEGLNKLTEWALSGLTDEQIASNMGIGRSTLYEWKAKHEVITNALKKGKEVVDIQVENALLKSALGYDYTEVTEERIDDTGEMVVAKKVTKHILPNTTAQIFWLKNRKPAEWRDRKDLEHSGKDGGPIQIEALTSAERQERIGELMEKMNKQDSGKHGIDAT